MSCPCLLSLFVRATPASGRWVAIRVALEDEDVGVMEEAIHRRAREEGIPEERPELLGVAVRGEDERAALVPEADHLVEVRGFVGGEGLETEVVEDEQVDPC